MSAKKSDGVGHENERSIRSNGLAVMSVCDGAKTRVRVGSAYSEEVEIEVCVHQGSVLLLLLLAIVVDVITENARRSVVT